MIWLLGGYMWLFIHRPFEVWPWLGDLHVERIYMIVTILYWALAAKKRLLPNRLNAAFGFFWIVLLASWLQSPYCSQGSTTVEDYFKIAVFYVLVITTVCDDRDLKCLVAMNLAAVGLYMAHSLREYNCGRASWAMGTYRMIGVDSTYNDANTFAATVVYTLALTWPLWSASSKKWHRWAILGYVALSVICILLTGSRMGFVGLSTLALAAVLISRHRLAIIMLLVIVAPLVWKSLPEDRQTRYLTLIDPSYGPANAQASAEGRSQGWHDGVRLWTQNPLLGVGPGAFALARGFNLQSHHLYGQILGEMGTLGAVAFGVVVLGFFANYFDMRRICRQEPDLRDIFSSRLIQSITITVILLLLMGLAGHSLYRYTWLWFGAFQAIALHCLLRHREELMESMSLPSVGTLDLVSVNYDIA
jgi:O-antigen ligase